MGRPSPLRRALRRTAVVLWLMATGHAAAGDSACGPEPADVPAVTRAVTDELDVTLADGRRLRLAGLEPPQATPISPGLPAQAHRLLEHWLAASQGGPVTLHLLSSTPDRWGRLPAQLFRAPVPSTGEPPVSAAEALIRAGVGRARPDPLAHGCFAALLRAEDRARLDRLGLWVDPRLAVPAAGSTALAEQAGGMALVEGLLHLHETRGTLYLALGRDRWGFTAVLSRRDAARFVRAGLDLHDYEGTPVRLRGDLDARFGLRLRLTDRDQFESLEPGSLAPAAEPNGPVAEPRGSTTPWDSPPAIPRSTGR